MKRLLQAFALLFAMVGTACPADVEFDGGVRKKKTDEVDGTTAAVNDLVEFRIKAPASSTVAVFVEPEIVYTSDSTGTHIAFFATKKGRFVFCCAVFDGKTVRKGKYIVQVGDGPAPPVPPDPPDPVVPTGFAGDVYKLATQVDSPTRAADAKAIAAVLKTVASEAGARTDMTYVQMQASFKTKSTAELSKELMLRWKDWSVKFNALMKSSGATTKDKAVTAFNEAVKGLEAVK